MLQPLDNLNVFQNNHIDIARREAILKILNRFCGLLKEPSRLMEIEAQLLQTEKSKFYIDYSGIMMVLAMGKSYLDPETDWDEVIYAYMQLMREEIQSRISYMGNGANRGVTAYCSSVSTVYNQTGYFKKFQDSLNELLFNRVDALVKEAQEQIQDMSMQLFDAISGFSGITRYILQHRDSPEKSNTIEACLRFLIDLCLEKEVEGIRVPCYHISSKNQFLEDEKIEYPKGAFNFSLSHGIAGPLMVLGTALTEGIELEGQREAIQMMLNDFYRFSSLEQDGSVIWPGRVSFESYVDNIVDVIPTRASWCYGTPGIGRSVYIASKAIGDKKSENLALQAMENLCKMPLEDYLLDSPILCHGYGGVLAILTAMYRDTGNVVYYKRMNEIVDVILGFYDEDSLFGFKDVYKYWEKGFTGPRPIVKEEKICFLEGTTGIILSLLGYLDETKSDWMKNLLID